MNKYIATDGGQIIRYDDELDKMYQPFILSQPSHIVKGPTADPKELCDQWIVVREHDKTPIVLNSFYELQDYLDVYTLNIKSNNPIIGIYGAYWRLSGCTKAPILETILRLDKELKIDFGCNVRFVDLGSVYVVL